MKYVATINGKKYEIEVERVDPYQPLSRGEKRRQKEAAEEEGTAVVRERSQSSTTETREIPKGEPKRAEEPQEASAGERSIESPLVGKVVRVLVQNGQQVKAGETLLLIEALKMETEIVAPVGGTVSGIAVEAGQQVEAGTRMLVIG